MQKIINLYNIIFTNLHKYSQDLFLLFARLYVADAFLRSGISKFQNWDTTLYLFENEYQVPFIPWEFAAYLATIGEIVLPVLFIFGIFNRLVALKLSAINIIAVVSYSILWQQGFYDHKLWGVLMLVSIIYGAGRFSIDNLLKIK